MNDRLQQAALKGSSDAVNTLTSKHANTPHLITPTTAEKINDMFRGRQLQFKACL